MTMNIFLTGATGYLGSSLVSRLIKSSRISKVVTLARNPKKVSDLLAKLGPSEKLELISGDLMSYKYNFSNIDVVIHLAWLHHPEFCENNSGLVFDTNIGGMQRIVESLWEFKVPYFIFTSQWSVYGKQETKLLHEGLIPNPNIAKSTVTYAGEVITKNLAQSRTKFAILRLAHMIGVNTLPDTEKIKIDITDKFAKATSIGGNLTIFSDGNQRTNLIHVRDVCECIYRLITSSDDVWNDTYNVAGISDISINELADTYIKVALSMGLTAPTKIYVDKEHYILKAGLASQYLDISKIKKKLGWTPSISIEETVKELIEANQN
jgi:nucleoside-diphosphate-sugar epimerase